MPSGKFIKAAEVSLPLKRVRQHQQERTFLIMSTFSLNQDLVRRELLDSSSSAQITELRNYRVIFIPIDTRDPQSTNSAHGFATLRRLKSQPTSQGLPVPTPSGAEHYPSHHCDLAEFGQLRIDFLRHETWRAGQSVDLTAFEFKVLRFFVANPCRVVSRDELLETVWGYTCYPTTRTVDNKILRLRQKLEPDPANPVHFLTVHGAGYKFVP
jgi:hypothetical protein